MRTASSSLSRLIVGLVGLALVAGGMAIKTDPAIAAVIVGVVLVGLPVYLELRRVPPDA